MVAFRLHPRLYGRLDPSDVVQEAYLEVQRRLDEYLAGPPLPIYLWLRRLVEQKLIDLHRYHLRAKARDARREVSMAGTRHTEASSLALACAIVAQSAPPSADVARKELEDVVRSALDEMKPIDREIIALRHFEELSNADTARELGIGPAAASKRHSAAMRRLGKALKGDLGRGR